MTSIAATPSRLADLSTTLMNDAPSPNQFALCLHPVDEERASPTESIRRLTNQLGYITTALMPNRPRMLGAWLKQARITTMVVSLVVVSLGIVVLLEWPSYFAAARLVALLGAMYGFALCTYIFIVIENDYSASVRASRSSEAAASQNV